MAAATIAGSASAAVPHQLANPVLGNSYSVERSRLEQPPPSVRHVCGFKPGEDVRTFAAVVLPTSRIYVVMPLYPNVDGDTFGTVLYISGQNCLTAEANWVLSGRKPASTYRAVQKGDPRPGLKAKQYCSGGVLGTCHYEFGSIAEERTVRMLAKDAINRAEVSATEYKSFVRSLCQTIHQSTNAELPTVNDEVGLYCRLKRSG